MDDAEERPDPDTLLNAIRQAEERAQVGKLKIFFGMAAGVGKTFEMLRSAQQQLQDGVDVVVGIVETHGRRETKALLDGLPQISLKRVEYRNAILYEMDLEAILARHPQLVLVDELAHTNAPGSRHNKRWQDVIELLDAGIDVYTTINVQHLESRKDVVEEIAGIAIRETVPDSIIERADNIELIDITPQGLLARLKEGKVYLGPQAQIAANNFFKEDRLTALREIALRFTAEKVDHDLHGMLASGPGSSKGWRPGERLMVAISQSPHSQQLIRSTRRLAFNLDCPWIAVHIDDGQHLSPDQVEMLAKNINLAHELGAEVVTTSDPDVAQAIQRIARQRSVTQILLGRPPPWKLSNFFQRETLLDRLASEVRDIDLHLIRQDEKAEETKAAASEHGWMMRHITPYLKVVAILSLIAAIQWMFLPFLGYPVIGLLFLLTVLVLSLFFDSGPVMLAALLSACLWNFVFISVVERHAILRLENVVLFAVYFLTALITGIFTTRIRHREVLLRHNEEQTQTLYTIIRLIAKAPSNEWLISTVEQRLAKTLDGECSILLKDSSDILNFWHVSPMLQDAKEQAVALWVFQNNKSAGWSTATLPSVKNLYLPIHGNKETVGIFAYHSNSGENLDLEEMNLLWAVLQQLGSYFERSMTEEKRRYAEYTKQIENVRATILNSISQTFKNPVTTLRKATQMLKADVKGDQVDKTHQLKDKMILSIQQIEASSESVNRVVNNVLSMSQLKAGFMQLQREKYNVNELVENCLNDLKHALKEHEVEVNLPDAVLEGFFDVSLLELMLCNLLLNAVDKNVSGSKITLSVRKQGEGYLFELSDMREPMASEDIQQVLQTSYPSINDPSQQPHLEWIIAKTVAEHHGGWLNITQKADGGLACNVYIPTSQPTETLL
jgi:two-component system sensor histidine kinase KdpD